MRDQPIQEIFATNSYFFAAREHWLQERMAGWLVLEKTPPALHWLESRRCHLRRTTVGLMW
jgi:hypothetical protein